MDLPIDLDAKQYGGLYKMIVSQLEKAEDHHTHGIYLQELRDMILEIGEYVCHSPLIYIDSDDVPSGQMQNSGSMPWTYKAKPLEFSDEVERAVSEEIGLTLSDADGQVSASIHLELLPNSD